MAQLDPTQTRQAIRIFWLTLLASQVVYVAVIVGLDMRSRREPVDAPALLTTLAVVSVAMGLGAHFSWRRASGAERPTPFSPTPPSSPLYRLLPPFYRLLPPFYLLAWLLDESIAICGLILGFLAFSPGVWIPFSLAAFVLMLIHRPS